MAYKNVETLIRGMRWLPGYTLHLLSRISPSRRAELEYWLPEGANVRFHNGVSDERYAELLADRAILVSASRDEGYGLPVAEALAVGVPVVLSDLQIFREVAGNAAGFFDPDTPGDFAEKIKELEQDELRNQRISAGATHIQAFSWKESARVLYSGMCQIVQNRVDSDRTRETAININKKR